MRRPLDDLDGSGPVGPSTPLVDVTFVVLDLETTGGSAQSCAITEVGALKFRGGECLGTFQTLVNPGDGVRLPPEIVYLTGITEAMVAPAPPIDSVLPAFAEFIGKAVIVGHNVRFDLGFLRANLARLGYHPLTNRFVDTYALARRLVRDEVPNCKLRTLARHFRTAADPCHRALDDARATAEVLHHLLERVASLGVTALDDLLALPTTAAHPQVAKLRWVASLPRCPGVYLFKDVTGRVLYVGRATDLRRRVRSYFSSNDRRTVGPLLREAHSLDHVVCVNDLEAAVLEVRLIHEHLPRYNRQVKAWSQYRYLKLTMDERCPRPTVVRAVKRTDGCLYLGPVPSAAAAKLAAEAIKQVVAGVAGVAGSPATILGALEARMQILAEAHRFDEVADTREGARSLARLLARQRRLEALVLAGRIEVELTDGDGGAVIDCGRLVETWNGEGRRSDATVRLTDPAAPSLPLAREAVAEVAVVAAWLEAKARKLRPIHESLCSVG